ncbi:MAG TPA: choice-of-anchor Q domain-containing protein [Gemmata sp.]|nr:choice-of-anchor Q domain-containing protein [Gemmata sp.]
MNTTLDEVTPGDGDLSLREAISRANTHPGADTIVLPAGVFRITLDGVNENANATGDFDVTDAVLIRGAGAGATIIDAQRKDRLFDVVGAFTAKFEDVTLRHGAGPNNGAAVQAVNANVKLISCVLSDNEALVGGGINAEGGNVTVVDSIIARNEAQGDGGGIRVGTGTLTMSGSSVRRNVSGGNGGGIFGALITLLDSAVIGNAASSTIGGGGIFASGTVNLTNSTVSGNSAVSADGGGIECGAAILKDSTISGNTAGGNGGGIDASSATLAACTISGNSAFGSNSAGGGVNADTATIANCTVSGNIAGGDGGGINVVSLTLARCTVSGNFSAANGGGVSASQAILENSTISENTATHFGGGVEIESGHLLNDTIAENSAEVGGGIFGLAGGISLRNTIVALNLVGPTGTGSDLTGTLFASRGHNLIGDGSSAGAFVNGSNGDIVGTNANPIDPRLGPLANNGGPTQTMALLAGSRAIDHGDNANLPPTDQRRVGFSRVKDGNGDGSAIVDIGAFER